MTIRQVLKEFNRIRIPKGDEDLDKNIDQALTSIAEIVEGMPVYEFKEDDFDYVRLSDVLKLIRGQDTQKGE